MISASPLRTYMAGQSLPAFLTGATSQSHRCSSPGPSPPLPFPRLHPLQLDLSNLKMNQSLAEFLGSPPGPASLQWLSLRAANLSGSLPEEWPLSTSLSSLFLQDNVLEGGWGLSLGDNVL